VDISVIESRMRVDSVSSTERLLKKPEIRSRGEAPNGLNTLRPV
jgi:hypothetical protein